MDYIEQKIQTIQNEAEHILAENFEQQQQYYDWRGDINVACNTKDIRNIKALIDKLDSVAEQHFDKLGGRQVYIWTISHAGVMQHCIDSIIAHAKTTAQAYMMSAMASAKSTEACIAILNCCSAIQKNDVKGAIKRLEKLTQNDFKQNRLMETALSLLNLVSEV